MKYALIILLFSCGLTSNHSYIMVIDNNKIICKRQLDNREYANCTNINTKETFSKIFISNQITVWRKTI